jgi:hypothetical protein
MLEALRNSADNMIDTDNDGSYIDNIIGGATEMNITGAGGALGAIAGALGGPVGAVAGLGVGGAAGSAIASPAGQAAHSIGDEFSDFLGTRDQSAENAGSHGNGVGAEMRNLMHPTQTGSDMALGGALLGGPTLGLPMAATGMAVGNDVDRLRDAFGHWAD